MAPFVDCAVEAPGTSAAAPAQAVERRYETVLTRDQLDASDVAQRFYWGTEMLAEIPTGAVLALVDTAARTGAGLDHLNQHRPIRGTPTLRTGPDQRSCRHNPSQIDHGRQGTPGERRKHPRDPRPAPLPTHRSPPTVRGCDHASLLVRRNDRYVTVGASDDVAERIGDLERSAGDGPCVDAIADETPQIEPT